MKCFNGDLSPGNVTFQRSSFWIHVFKVMGTHIANKIGNLLMIDALKCGLVWGPFLRIRVDIDITKPLMRGKIIHIANLEEG